ncbi:MFS transporter [Streptomyces sp. DG2A-72]|uniref:MFS transporter n=1 Tax=Streptomyces sp. DG2A-72 TaxID=3051386 RepID=UPI003463B646
MPLVGRAIDRYGPRRVIAAVGAAFGAILISLSFVTGIVGLTAGFVGVRMAGQGALSLVATTTVAYWFDKRRGLALGITSAVGTAGISLAPLLVERLVSAYGWRQSWAIEGVAVWLIVIPSHSSASATSPPTSAGTSTASPRSPALPSTPR